MFTLVSNLLVNPIYVSFPVQFAIRGYRNTLPSFRHTVYLGASDTCQRQKYPFSRPECFILGKNTHFWTHAIYLEIVFVGTSIARKHLPFRLTSRAKMHIRIMGFFVWYIKKILTERREAEV